MFAQRIRQDLCGYYGKNWVSGHRCLQRNKPQNLPTLAHKTLETIESMLLNSTVRGQPCKVVADTRTSATYISDTVAKQLGLARMRVPYWEAHAGDGMTLRITEQTKLSLALYTTNGAWKRTLSCLLLPAHFFSSRSTNMSGYFLNAPLRSANYFVSHRCCL